MLISDRRQEIIRILRENRSASVNDLSDYFSVSPETIRRDLRQLEKDNRISRVYGGAYIDSVQQTTPVSMRKSTLRKEKERIAEICSSFIENGDTVMLDSSTTAYYIALELMSNRNITVITNSMEISYLLSPAKSINLICAVAVSTMKTKLLWTIPR